MQTRSLVEGPLDVKTHVRDGVIQRAEPFQGRRRDLQTRKLVPTPGPCRTL